MLPSIPAKHLCGGYVLTGGQSSRMGQDKALLLIGDRPLAVRTAEMVKNVCGNVTLVGSRHKYARLGFPVIEDTFPDQGPLAGIHAALSHSGTRFNLIVGCDMPYLSAEFLNRLLEIARTGEADAVVPESEAFGLEPLCAVYSLACLAPIEDALRKGDGKIARILEQVRTRRVTREECRPFDRNGKLFCNLNQFEDYEEALRDFREENPALALDDNTGR